MGGHQSQKISFARMQQLKQAHPNVALELLDKSLAKVGVGGGKAGVGGGVGGGGVGRGRFCASWGRWNRHLCESGRLFVSSTDMGHLDRCGIQPQARSLAPMKMRLGLDESPGHCQDLLSHLPDDLGEIETATVAPRPGFATPCETTWRFASSSNQSLQLEDVSEKLATLGGWLLFWFPSKNHSSCTILCIALPNAGEFNCGGWRPKSDGPSTG